ncbi:glycosyltransferase [Algoriphagus mannitolivorans]|uniref:glycosyltransferase n=1 Tax=Algoriphagus mannitolivorans TaxID=226504 RepID=UPI000406BC75|nr:glycosyltransferase [Algoriphagus mannitolivorans]
MISLVVSSYRKEDFTKFSSSVEETIGVPFEIIKIENRNQFNLSKAYNQGARQAQFDCLVFVHEDVTFESEGWGRSLISLFGDNPDVGIVGVAGAIKKSYLPTGWGTGTSLFDRIHMNQGSQNGTEFQSTQKENAVFEKVKVLDGVFLATQKDIWEEFPFDESLDGFHLYDIDFSLRITQKYTGIISYEILLTHYSTGNYDSDWVQKTLNYHSRVDKRDLFDRDESYFSKSRRAWYKALTFPKIHLIQRKKFLDQMGMDLLSSVHAFCFRFPWIGRIVFKSLAVLGL